MEAVKLKQVDYDYRNHLQAFLNFVVKAEKKAGKYKTKPVYNTFEKFFNYERAIKKAKNNKNNEPSKFSNLYEYLKNKKGG